MKREQQNQIYKEVVMPLTNEQKEKLLSVQELRLYRLLNNGGQWSTLEMSQKLILADPRKIISRIRRKGITISDMWCIGVNGARFKRYFIHR